MVAGVRPRAYGLRHTLGMVRRRKELGAGGDGSECCVCAAWAEGVEGLILDAGGGALDQEDAAEGVEFVPVCVECADLYRGWVYESEEGV